MKNRHISGSKRRKRFQENDNCLAGEDVIYEAKVKDYKGGTRYVSFTVS